MSQIVIVDDRITNRNILSRLATSLTDGGCVHAFSDPAEALDWIEHNTPDLVITDFKMPTMDGSEFIRHVRRQAACLDVPVMVVTVYDDRSFRYQALEAGATDFLLSPVDHHEFVTRAQNLLTLRKQQQIIKRRAHSLEQRLLSAMSQHREELRESRRLMSMVIDTIPAMVVVSDGQGRCVLANSYQARFFGTCPDDLVGRNLVAAFGADYGERHCELDRQVIDTGEPVTSIEEVAGSRSEGRRCFLTTKAPLRNQGGEVTHVVTVALDITERTRIEQALRRSKHDAERANLAKTRFLAHMSHELRTPLNAILGFAELLKSEMFGPLGADRYRDYASDIHSSGEHLLALISNILDAARIEAGHFELAEEDNPVEALLQGAVAAVEDRARAGNVELATRLQPPGLVLRADPDAIREILGHLMANAMRFTGPGGRVEMAAEVAEGGGIQITVADTGVGIPPERISALLHRFEAIEDPLSRSGSGAGLGLPLAADLMALHDGTLSVTSALGQGTRVTLSFPPVRTVRAAAGR